eukprot:RCo050519
MSRSKADWKDLLSFYYDDDPAPPARGGYHSHHNAVRGLRGAPFSTSNSSSSAVGVPGHCFNAGPSARRRSPFQDQATFVLGQFHFALRQPSPSSSSGVSLGGASAPSPVWREALR